MKLFFKRYLLNILLSIGTYVYIFLISVLTDNWSGNFFNIPILIFVIFFLLLRTIDDYEDYYKDYIKGKTFTSRYFFGISSTILFLGFITLSIIGKYYLFITLLIPLSLLRIIKKWYISCWIAPLSILFLITYSTGMEYIHILTLLISLIISLIFALRKKKSDYSINEVGGKGYHLLKMNLKETPPFIVIPASVLFPFNKEIVKAYIKSFCKKHKKYAVRSSGIDEDSNDNSFAGVHDTYLNVGYNEIEENVLKVIESATSDIALSYRKNNNLSLKNIKMAVVIQEMIEANFAGVINTINPITNNTFETVISVCEGTGDKLVNGDVDGSNYYVNGKEIKVKGDDILNRKILKKILNLSYKVASKTNRFQDIEFAVKKNKVFFLQTRDITTYKDVDSQNLTLLIDNSNIIESYYGVVSPLTESFAKEIYEKVYKATFELVKAPKKVMDTLDNSFKNMLYCYEGKIYYNLFSWYHINSVFPSKKSLSFMENMMGVKTSSSGYKKVKVNIFALIKSLSIFLRKLTRITPLSIKFLKKFDEIVNPYYSHKLNLTNEECISLYNSISNDIVPEFTTPILNDTAVMFYFGSLKEKAKKYPNSDKIISTAVNNNGNVESAASATEFDKILNIIKDNEIYLNDFANLEENDLMDKYYYQNNDLEKIIKKYIYSYGSRVMNELKLETITMIENPQMIFTMLKHSLSFKSSNEVIIEKVEIPRKLQNTAKKARKYIQNREKLRLKRTYIFSVVRNIFLNLGRNFAKEGKIDHEDDIFYLTRNEIFLLNEDYRKIVEQRKIERENFKKCEYYDRVAFYGDKILPVLFSEGSNGLNGIPSGKGKVTAKVSILENSNDPFTPGNIIVTKRTDPGWISLFPLASGLIVEHGSMLSHSFVVAREIGLPAVVGVIDATKYIKDGDIVTLDALKGEITIEH